MIKARKQPVDRQDLKNLGGLLLGLQLKMYAVSFTMRDSV